jgi:hypothetical protein
MAKSSGGAVNKIPWIHHTSHQAGSTDPINLAGLAGEPATLAAHRALTIGAHGITAPVSFRVYRTAAQSIPAGGNEIIGFDTVVWDTGPYYNLGNYRFVPLIAGVYLITIGVRMSGLLNGKYWQVQLVTGAGDQAQLWQIYTGADGDVQGNGSALVALNGAGDYVQAWIYHNDAGARDLLVGTLTTTYMSGFLIK